MSNYIFYGIVLFFCVFILVFIYILYLFVNFELEFIRSRRISGNINRTINRLIRINQLRHDIQAFQEHQELQKKINNQIKSRYVVIINPNHNLQIGNESQTK